MAKMKKAQFGTIEKKTSPGGMYKSKVMKDAQGNVLKETQRRTLKGVLSGAPRGAGKKASMKTGGVAKAQFGKPVTTTPGKSMKMGGKMSKKK